MQGIILALLMRSRFLSVFLICSSLLMGHAFAGGPKNPGLKTELTPIRPTQVNPPPTPTPVVLVAPPAPKPKKCFVVERSTVSYSPSYVVALSGMTVDICGCCGSNQVWLPGVYANVPVSVQTAVEYVQVCN
jgi:hypothetical protein